jgi:hypothetical protein
MIEAIIGLVFMLVGGIFALASIFTGEDLISGIVGCVFGLIFFLVGGSTMGSVVKQFKADKATKKYGTLRIGKIVDYRDSHVKLNNVPLLIVGIAVYENGVVNLYYSDTGQTSEKPYPIGAYLQVKVYNGDINIVKNSIGSYYMPEEERALEEYVVAMKAGKAPLRGYIPGSYAAQPKEEDTIVINGVRYKKAED